MKSTLQEESPEAGAPIELVDEKRKELQANVNKLRSALQHWQKWEIDYGEFLEKLETVSNEPSLETLRSIRDSIDTTLIKDQELKELLGLDKDVQRSRDQICALLSRRIDYMQQNASSLQKQLTAAEQDLDSIVGTDESLFQDETGLPITEILEELDDHDNVISGKTSTAKDAASGAVGLLQKAGIKGWTDPLPTNGDHLVDNQTSGAVLSEFDKQSTAQSDSMNRVTPVVTSKRKKSVAFAPDIQVAPPSTRRGSSPPPLRSSSPPPKALPPTPIKSKPSVPWEVAEARKGRFHEGDRVIELNDDDEEIGSLPVVPPEDFEESEEDARLRREMTEYALNEVGAIVAEMDLEEGSDYDDEDELDIDEEHQADSDEEDENEFGMTAFDRISDEDRKQMLELEKKLQAKMMQNIGPQSGLESMEINADDVRRLVVKTDNESEANQKGRRSSKVHFADEDEVLPTPSEPESAVDPKPAFADTIVERTGAAMNRSEGTPPTKTPSRFKSSMSGNARTANQLKRESQKSSKGQGMPSIPIHLRDEEYPARQKPETPTGPEGQILATKVLERPTPPAGVLPPDESGMDPVLLQRELAVENRRLLNNMVQQQGGFKPSPEEEDNPLMEERDGKVRKVSRFKAARIHAGGI